MSPRRQSVSLGFLGVVILIGAQAFESTGTALKPKGELAWLWPRRDAYATSSILMRPPAR